MIYSYIMDYPQLDRVQDLRDLGCLRILHVLLDDSSLEDRYIVIVDCSEQQAVMIHLL